MLSPPAPSENYMALAGQPCAHCWVTPLETKPSSGSHLVPGAGSCPEGRAGGSFHYPELPTVHACPLQLRTLLGLHTQPHSSAFSSEETQQPTGLHGA